MHCERDGEVFFDECTNRCKCQRTSFGTFYARCTEKSCTASHKLKPYAAYYTQDEFDNPSFKCEKTTEWFHVDCNFCQCKVNGGKTICSKRDCNTFEHWDNQVSY